MEALYKKLFDKYTKLKTNKLSHLELLNNEQEEKFLNYVAAAEDLIEHLRSENDQLHGQINDLRNELTSVRYAKDNQVADYQRLLTEESRKSEALFEEVEKLQKLLKDGTTNDLNDEVSNKDDQFNNTSHNSSIRMTRKHVMREQDALVKKARFISCENEGNSGERESAQSFDRETTSNKLLEFSTKANDQSGVDLQESGHPNWLIQALFEYTLDMKLSTDNQTGRLCLSAMHQSSGYSFSLSWIGKASGEEAELLYHVISLGTLERIAPEWMREDIMFSPTMCPIFFERVSHMIKFKH